MLALGIIIPFAAAHGLGMSGNIFLPMHIPVFLCGFFCGPFYGAVCGAVLPLLNSILTGMPVLFPTGICMCAELFTYGLVSGLLYKFMGYGRKLHIIYFVLVISMLAGRVVYGIFIKLLLLAGMNVGKLSVIASVITGLPGIIIHLILIPAAVFAVRKNINKVGAARDAVNLIKQGRATCVVAKKNKVISKASPHGIAYIIDLYEKGELCGAFVADTIIGKAAAMVFTLAGVKSCYGKVVSDGAVEWLNSHGVDVSFTTKVSAIQNRKGDGICPMEETVADINNEKEAVEALKNKIKSLSK